MVYLTTNLHFTKMSIKFFFWNPQWNCSYCTLQKKMLPKKEMKHKDITIKSILNPALASCVCMHTTDKATKD